jgi:lysophospholipase L1-like esterase
MSEGKPSTGPKSPRWRGLLGWLLFALSLVANFGLGLSCLKLYRRELGVRLHPTGPVPVNVARAEGRTQVLFLGDSRMEEWPELARARFATVNAGVGGETTAQVRLRAAATLDAVRPEFVVLQAGVNDLKSIGALPGMAVETEEQCLANLIALVELCRERGARVVLVPVLPTSRPSLARRPIWSSEIDAARRRVNAALRTRFQGAPGVAVLEDNLLRPDSADYRDTLHFSATGYAKLEAATLKSMAAL